MKLVYIVRSWGVVGVFFLIVGCGQPPADPTPRSTDDMQNGTDIPASEFPAVVTLNGCSGELIDANWVITASHCLASSTSNPSGVAVQAGTESRTLSAIYLPPTWVSGDLNTDLALGKLNTPITDIAPLPLFTGYLAAQAPVTLVGFGISQNAGNAKRMGPMVLASSTAPGIDQGGALPTIVNLLPTTGNVGPCSGDSGGAVLTQVNGAYQIVGVTVAATYGTTTTCGTVVEGYAVNPMTQSAWIYSTTGITPPSYQTAAPTCTLTFSPAVLTASVNAAQMYYPNPVITPSAGAIATEILALPSGTPYLGSFTAAPGTYQFEALVGNELDGHPGSCVGTLTIGAPAAPPPTPVTPTPTPTPPPPSPPACSPQPISNAGPNRTIKKGQVITLGSPPVAGTTYKWVGSNGRKATTARIQVSPAVTTVFTLTAKNKCGTATSSATVTVTAH